MKNKTAGEIVRALKLILGGGRHPKRHQTDKGKEFLNSKVQTFLREHGIRLFVTESEKKASIVERFNRTLKGRMYKYFTAKNTYRYADVLQELVTGYNDTHHRSIGMKPSEVREIDQPKIRQRLYSVTRKTKKKV